MKRAPITRRALLGSALSVAAVSASGASLGSIFRDAKAPTAVRARDLLARMSLDEKVAQLGCAWMGKAVWYDENGDFSPARARATLTKGIGQIARPSDYRGLNLGEPANFRTIANTVAFVNGVQKFLVEETRLGIPALFHDELAHGLLAADATIFPIPTGLGSTWDPDLVEQVFAASASEARARGTTIALTPVIDLLRDPRWGRSEEFFGEDPHLVAQMGVAAVRGIQGRARPLGSNRVFATLKHFVHGTPQGGLNIAPADMSERMLREAYLVPFAEVIAKTDPAAVMPSYNEVGGVPSHADPMLLGETGRGRLGFKGLYMSDYGGIANLEKQHHIASGPAEAAALALRAGVQTDLPDGESFAYLPELVRSGKVAVSLIDEAVFKVLQLKFEAGLFEQPYADTGRAARTSADPEHARLAYTAAAKSVILLKNDGIAPLDGTKRTRLAVIGPNAAEPLFGGYSGANPRAVGVLQGLRERAPAGVTIDHADGVWITAPDDQGLHRSYSASKPLAAADNLARIKAAVELAIRSDVVLLVLGDVPAITREAVDWTLPGDRESLGLWGQQDALVEAISATGKPLVVLLLNGRPLAVPALAKHANALFEGWYLGEAGGSAFADILFGKVNPGGKLPVSLPRSVGALPVHYDRHPSADINHYLEEGPRALYPFGHGLSYTSFEIGKPRLTKPVIERGESVGVAVDVKNTGPRTGDEVVQLYIRDEVSSVPRPVLELRKFQRVTLAPGEIRTLTFELKPDDLAFWDARMRWVVEAGMFTISAGSSSTVLKSARLEVTA